MKRSPLRRTSSLRRSRMKPWLRDPDDKVCIAARYDPTHQCMTRFRQPHAPDDRKRLTLDHVHHAATTGKRAKSNKWHLVAACGWANNEGWCSANRQTERDYLREVELDNEPDASGA